MLTPQQESTLTSGGDSFDHYHSEDRRVTHQTLSDLSDVVFVVEAPSSYTVTGDEDVIVCPMATTMQLPLSKSKVTFEVIMTGTGFVLCNCFAGDLVYGQASVELQVQGTALRFFGVSGGWVFL